MLPGLPLDGGRALRAGVWALLKDRNRATMVAGWAGRGIALCTGVSIFTLYRLNLITLFGLIFILLVVFTLWQGAGQSIRLARMTSRFPLVDLGALTKPVLRRAVRHTAGRGPAAAPPMTRTGAERSPSRTRPAGWSPWSTRMPPRRSRPSGGPGWRSTRSPGAWTDCPR